MCKHFIVSDKMCNECSKLKIVYDNNNAKCFFHIAKNILLNNNFEYIKK
jgi:hypothetical protein